MAWQGSLWAEMVAETASAPEAVSEVVSDESGDYFDAIQPSRLGYLLWPERPVKVYVEPAVNAAPVRHRSRIWVEAVEGAIADWAIHFPLEQTMDQEQAHIQVLRQQPPLSWPPEQSRASHAETRFQLLMSTHASGEACWEHRQTVFLGDRQGPNHLRGTARHELGHALGLWGHSPNPDDALYAEQVGVPPEISSRDLRTLERLYQQPTQLGCT